MQQARKTFVGSVDFVSSSRGNPAKIIETMDHSSGPNMLDSHARCGESVRVCLAFVAKRVALGCDDYRRTQVREIGTAISGK